MKGSGTVMAVSRILTLRRGFQIDPAPPFQFDGTFHKPSHFPSALEVWEPGAHWHAIRIDGRLFGLKIEDRSGRGKPALVVSVYDRNEVPDDEIEAIREEIAWRFDLDAGLSEFNRLAEGDGRFSPVFGRWLGMRNSTAHSLYELLVIAVLLQNATVRRTVQMMDALLGRYGTRLEFDGRELFAMWRPEDLGGVPEQELRDLKTGYRARFLKRVSEDFARGRVDEHALRGMDGEDAKKELMKLYGVGPETARILLFEACHQYDTFGHIAPWQQTIYSRLFYKRPSVAADQIRDDITSRYGRYSMLAVHYIWEDIFWRRKSEKIGWLEKEIRL